MSHAKRATAAAAPCQPEHVDRICPNCVLQCPCLSLSQIKELSTRYSEFISFPIEVWAEKTSYDQVPDTSVEVAEGEEPKMKTVTRTAMQWEVRPDRGFCVRAAFFFFFVFFCLVCVSL